MVLKKAGKWEAYYYQPDLNQVKRSYIEYWFDVKSKTRHNNVKEITEDIISNKEEKLLNLNNFLNWNLP